LTCWDGWKAVRSEDRFLRTVGVRKQFLRVVSGKGYLQV
jgi:hypothetical protein